MNERQQQYLVLEYKNYNLHCRYYEQNRAPYMMPFHTNWFQIKELEGGLHKFIDWAIKL